MSSRATSAKTHIWLTWQSPPRPGWQPRSWSRHARPSPEHRESAPACPPGTRLPKSAIWRTWEPPPPRAQRRAAPRRPGGRFVSQEPAPVQRADYWIPLRPIRGARSSGAREREIERRPQFKARARRVPCLGRRTGRPQYQRPSGALARKRERSLPRQTYGAAAAAAIPAPVGRAGAKAGTYPASADVRGGGGRSTSARRAR